MIYASLEKTQPIKQGDIFYPLPLPIMNLENIRIVDKDDIKESDWMHIINEGVGSEIVMHVPAKLTWGIVASQNCDAIRSPFITFFEIGTFEKVTGATLPNKPNKWMKFITRNSRLSAKWFYLPADEDIGFKERMAVNFQKAYIIQRENLEKYVEEIRKGRLNDIAYQHYRESISHYFRRYPYDEWYPLTKDEFEEYMKDNKDSIVPFDWQK